VSILKIGFIGLGRMGRNMVLRLKKNKQGVVAYNRSPEKVKDVMKKGVTGAFTLKELVEKLLPPRIIWIMVPAGDPVDKMITGLLPYLNEGDILIDGGNSNYHDSMRRAEYLKTEGIYYLDVGTSGGLGGEKKGYCLMIGGEKQAYGKVEPLFKVLATKEGYNYVGSSGSGHYVKMVHNGIEYALLQSYGEGFELLKNGPFNLDLEKISKLWQNGSVIRSWLLELAEDAFKKDPQLKKITDFIGGGSTGRWTVEESLKLETPSPMISLALALRFRTRQKESFSGKVVAALRKEFGGHEVKKSGKS
jgi:6-phosphogluconate dehydrogenase